MPVVDVFNVVAHRIFTVVLEACDYADTPVLVLFPSIRSITLVG